MAASMTWSEYGETCRKRGAMAKEVFACTTTPARDGPPPPDLLAAHLAYQQELEAKGQLFLAGPLSNADATRLSGAGLIVYLAENIDEARKLAEADPMHREGQRKFQLQAWRLNEGAPFGLPGLSRHNPTDSTAK